MTAPSSRLFLRMATYITVAILGVLLLGLGSLVVVTTGELDSYLGARKNDLGRDAAQVLYLEGETGLRDWLQDEKNIPEGVAIFVLNEQGVDVGGRELPAMYRNFVARFVVPDRRDTWDFENFRPLRLTPQLRAADGSIYAFLLIPARVAPWGSITGLTALLAASLVVIVVFAAWIAYTFSRPMSALQLTVRELAAGRTSARAPESLSVRPDELGELARDFNAMAERLETLLESRKQLMRDMSHELRSPLARLQAAFALMENKQTLPPVEHARIIEEIGRMDRAIGDVLQLSNLETTPVTGKYLLNVDRLLADLIQDEELEAETLGVKLDLHSQPDLEVVGDPGLLRSGFENVLRNAMRHAPRDSIVQIKAYALDEASIRVQIEDRGPGVAPALLEKIFEPHVRFPKDAGDTRGSGLGLAIARRVFELHGGSIHATLAEPSGLRVQMQLPVA